MGTISYLEYLVKPEYRKNPFDGLIGWILEKNRPPSVEDLQNQYAFTYYSTMNKAVTDVNNGTTANSDSTKDSAVAGVYTDENGGKNVVLLKDHTESAQIDIYVDMTINLGGHTLSADGNICLKIRGGNITIDGRLAGSSIVQNSNTVTSICIQTPSSSTSKCVYINGGTYLSNCPNGQAEVITNRAKVCEMVISNCNIIAKTDTNTAYGIFCLDGTTVTVNNCDIKAYSDYHKDDNNSNYSASSLGVANLGTLTLNDCKVMGTHSGVESNGTLTVNGGTYEGYGHGGFYFSGNGETAYVMDAVMRDCDMPDGYTATSNRNGAGFYLGGDGNNKVYMDNCDIYGISASQIIVIKTTDNTLYISNSTINNTNGGDANVRIDSGNTLYLGVGNNFTAEDTNNPSAVIVTDEVYVQGVA